jgi:hypothetical protein
MANTPSCFAANYTPLPTQTGYGVVSQLPRSLFRLAQRTFAALQAIALCRFGAEGSALASPPFLLRETADGSFSFAMQWKHHRILHISPYLTDA